MRIHEWERLRGRPALRSVLLVGCLTIVVVGVLAFCVQALAELGADWSVRGLEVWKTRGP